MSRSTYNLLLTVLLFACSPLLVKAEVTFFTFEGDYVDGGNRLLAGHNDQHININNNSDQYGEPDGWIGSSPTTLVGRSFSDSVPFSPPMDYNGPVFFGGGSVTSTNGPNNEGFHELYVRNGGSGDSIHWRVDSNNPDSHSNHMFVYFKRQQFNSAWNSGGPITSTNLTTSAFNLSTGQVLQAGLPDIEARWVIKDGLNNFYVSENSFLIAQNNSYQTNFSAITGWAQYDPTGGLSSLDFDPGMFGSQFFTDIQGFGFYIEHESLAQSTHVDINGFSVTVPEPSSLLLCGVVALIGGIYLRRR